MLVGRYHALNPVKGGVVLEARGDGNGAEESRSYWGNSRAISLRMWSIVS